MYASDNESSYLVNFENFHFFMILSFIAIFHKVEIFLKKSYSFYCYPID